ncbi:hypothetical protein [Marinomonas sp. SBI22]
MNYQGTLLLVSHDRAFLDNVVTSVIAFEGEGVVREYVGGYQDWIRQGGRFVVEPETPEEVKALKPQEKVKTTEAKKPKSKSKLSYKMQRELDAMPDTIAKIEAELDAIVAVTSADDFYSQDQDVVQAELNKMTEIEAQLEQQMDRWVELEELQNG